MEKGMYGGREGKNWKRGDWMKRWGCCVIRWGFIGFLLLGVGTSPVGAQVIREKTFGGKRDDRAYGVSVMSDGSMVVAGYTESFSTEWGDVYVIKIPPTP